ncbi:hypothetical protein MTO96_006625 [Rhipicephalus appendiculatus]
MTRLAHRSRPREAGVYDEPAPPRHVGRYTGPPCLAESVERRARDNGSACEGPVGGRAHIKSDCKIKGSAVEVRARRRT